MGRFEDTLIRALSSPSKYLTVNTSVPSRGKLPKVVVLKSTLLTAALQVPAHNTGEFSFRTYVPNRS